MDRPLTEHASNGSTLKPAEPRQRPAERAQELSPTKLAIAGSACPPTAPARPARAYSYRSVFDPSFVPHCTLTVKSFNKRNFAGSVLVLVRSGTVLDLDTLTDTGTAKFRLFVVVYC